jgi:predicted AlkP superfamily pyrophosphatase or phosphodiesterase
MENDLDGWRWYAEEIAVPPVWQVAEEHGIATAIVYWPVTVGAKVHWRVPEFWRASNEHDLKLQRVVATPGLLEAVASRHSDFWSRFQPPAIQDDALVDITEHLLETEKPRLLLMHLVEVDTQQHRHGIGSPEARAAIEKDDAQVGRVVRALERHGLLDETALIVASDHGFREAPNAVRPCALLTEAGLVTQQAGKIVDWRATVHAHAGEAYVYLKDRKDMATAERVRDVFTARLRDPKSGIARLYDAAELQQLGGDTTAAFALGAAPGYQFAPGCRGAYRVESNGYRATHGFDPRDSDMRASLLMMGPSIPHGTIAGARLIDIAPTIAGWLGLPMPGVDGKPLRVTAAP